jgi:hypothetical protein
MQLIYTQYQLRNLIFMGFACFFRQSKGRLQQLFPNGTWNNNDANAPLIIMYRILFLSSFPISLSFPNHSELLSRPR